MQESVSSRPESSACPPPPITTDRPVPFRERAGNEDRRGPQTARWSPPGIANSKFDLHSRLPTGPLPTRSSHGPV